MMKTSFVCLPAGSESDGARQTLRGFLPLAAPALILFTIGVVIHAFR